MGHDGPKCPICRAVIKVDDKRIAERVSENNDRRSNRSS